jgi:tetratricopeptide (TPR) repeat protein
MIVALSVAWTPVAAGTLDTAGKLVEQGKYEEAKRILEVAVDNPAAEADRLLSLTRVCNELEDFTCGVRYGEQAVQTSSDSSSAHYLYAQALRIKMSKVSKVKAMFSLGAYKKHLNRALELEPQNLDAREEEIGYLANAPSIAGGDLKKARQRVEELESLDRHRALRMQVMIEFKDENEPAAVAAMREILESHPDDFDTRFNLAFWYQRNEHWADADEQFTRLVAHESSRIALNALYQRARTRVLGEYEQEQAVLLLTEYLERLPEQPQGVPGRTSAYWRLGNAYEQLERRADARQAYERALALDSKNVEAKRDLKQLGKN